MKGHIDQLAIFGGTPSFADQLHVGRPNVGDQARLLGRISDALARRWLTNDGPFLREFEQRIARLVDVQHCVAMCNGTVALELAIRALGLTGEVIVPSFTFVATVHALQSQGITPVFCDVDARTHNILADQVGQLVTPRTSGIVGVHLWGRGCAVDQLQAVAERHRLKVLYDAAHALACTINGRMIGGFGQAEVLSFHATKFLNTFEGGAVVTNDAGLAAVLKRTRNFGFEGYDMVTSLGTNGKMSEISAAMGLTGLEALDTFVESNRANYECYRAQLQGIPGVMVSSYDPSERSNYQYVIVEVDEAEAAVSRDIVLRVLHAENVLARRYFYPGVHRMEPYRTLYPDVGQRLPETERLCKQVIVLPTGTTVGRDQVREISHLIRLVVSRGREVARRLSRT